MSDKSAFHPLLPNEEERYKPISADLTCRKCGKKSKVQLRACVNVSLHPEEKEQILNGSFFKFTCPDCGHTHELFSKGGGEALAKRYNAPLLARLPIDPRFMAGCDNGDLDTALRNAPAIREAMENVVRTIQ